MPKKKSLFVHLGTVGYQGKAMELRAGSYRSASPLSELIPQAKRNLNIEHHSVDIQPHKGELPLNVKHFISDFRSQLEQYANNSVSGIRSKLALGFHGYEFEDAKEYTLSTFKVAHKKLVSGGKMVFTIDSLMDSEIKKQLIESGFEREKIKIKRLPPNKRKAHLSNKTYPGIIYEVTAIK